MVTQRSCFFRMWWTVFPHIDFLHPEYEIPDWRGRSYFADFGWLTPFLRFLIEIKGYASHVRDMDRQKYSNELNRETFLFGMGYNVISFAYDDIEQRPELCISLLRLALSRFQTSLTPVSRALLAEKEVIRLAACRVEPIRPKDVADHFEVDIKTAINILRTLCSKGWLSPIRGSVGGVEGRGGTGLVGIFPTKAR